MIYAVQPTAGGPTKIGHSEDVPARIRQLEAHYGRPLALLATLPGGLVEERAIHRRFAHLRLGRTEQFRPAADLMAFFGRPLLVTMNPAATEAMPYRRDLADYLKFRVSGVFKDWFERFADSERSDMSDLFDDCVVAYAKARGFEPPPKR